VDETTTTPEQQLAWEAERRPIAATAAVIAGITTLAGTLYIQAGLLSDYPRVGVLEAITPALNGQADAAADPRSAGLLFLDDKAPQLIAASVVSAIGTLLIGYVLYYLFRGVRARRPEVSPALRYLAIAGPVVVALAGVGRQITSAIETGDFAAAGDRSAAAVDAVQDAGAFVAAGAAGFFGQLALALALVLISLNAMRVGLLTRFMGVLGIIVGVLFVIPLGPLPIVQAFWLVALAPLIALRWPGGQPPAWVTGEAEPWPSATEVRQQREAQRNRTEAKAIQHAPAASEPDGAEPVRPAHPSSKKRRKKRR
jgi:hypothetical protein